jgi:hypothetical protein
MAGTDYTINYDDERFTQIESEKNDALTEIEGTYDNMIGQTDKFYQDQIDASKQWADKQSQLQQEKTDFTIEQIEQQKAQANKDYLKEQAASYVDWQKQSNPYGAKAEQLASNGLTNTGYSESSQVSMYNTYQNRVATAREAYNTAVLNYNNAIKDARLQNNAALAEIAANALQQQLELALSGFQYKNNLVLEQANKKLEVDQMYYNRYQDVLQQINTENAMAEEIRQFNQDYQLRVDQFNKEYEQRLREFDEQIRQFNEEMERLKKKDEQEHQLELERLQLEKDQLTQQKYEFTKRMEAEAAALEEEKRQFDILHPAGGGTVYTGKTGGSNGGIWGTVKKMTSAGQAVVNKTKTAVSSVMAKKYPVNMQSVLDLGYGPISSSYLVKLQEQGKVTSYVKNGQTYFNKVQATGLNKYLKTM